MAVGRSFLERKENRPLRLTAGYNSGELVLGVGVAYAASGTAPALASAGEPGQDGQVGVQPDPLNPPHP